MTASYLFFLVAVQAAIDVSARVVASGQVSGHIGGVPVYNFDTDAVGVMSADPQEWIFMAKSTATDAQVHSLCADAKECTSEGHPDEGGIGFVSVRATLPELEALASKHKVDLDFLEPSVAVEAIGASKHPGAMNPLPEFEWGLDRIDDAKGLDGSYHPPNGADGKGVHVYVFDTGIHATHEDFGDRVVPEIDWCLKPGTMTKCKSTDPKGVGNACAGEFDGPGGHGTHCAGSIGGRLTGVAKNVSLHAVKVLSGNCGTTGQIAAAMDWILTDGEKPAVMSMSLGIPSPMIDRTFEAAIDKSVAAGVTVVLAAGNHGQDACKYTPAFVKSAITVGATDKHDKMAGFSGWGECVDIYAPGVNIVSAHHRSSDAIYCQAPSRDGRGNQIPGNPRFQPGMCLNNEAYWTMSGTSMACPHVSGAIALLLQQNPNMKPKEIEEALIASSTKAAIKGLQGTSFNRLLNTNFGPGKKPEKPESGRRRRRSGSSRRRRSSSRRRRRRSSSRRRRRRSKA